MNKNQYISKLILKKSSKFLKISLSLFAFSLGLISLFLALFFNQYLQIKKDFVDNENTHMIEISLKEKNNTVDSLNFKELPKIKEKIGAKNKKIRFQAFNAYQLNIGLVDEKEKTHFLYALEDVGTTFLGLDKMQVDTLYNRTLEGEKTILSIPFIDVQADGMISHESKKQVFTNSTKLAEKTPFDLYEGSLDRTYVHFSSYKKIIESIYKIPWEKFVEKYDRGESFGIQPIAKIYVYVEDIKDVEFVANIIEDNGYMTNYTFKSFDHFSESIKNTTFISLFFVVFVFFMSSLYIFLSFSSYLKVQQKDMGILKHYGFEEKQLRKIYSINIHKIFIRMFLFITLFIALISFVFLREVFGLYFLIIECSVLLPLFLVNQAIVFFILKKLTRQSVLDLIKRNKEFE